MAIQPGGLIGHYEILSPLGEGGMGEVWKAHDSRINRDVAIKVLHERVAFDADRLARFEQEAQAAGALNHPNILTVFEMGTHDGRPYLVTELLQGASLRERLGDTHRGSTSGERLPVRKALDFGAQIANGLAAAHDKGIVHRDLKPDNVFVTTDGRVKILDFGLAKLTAALGDESNLTDAQTEQRQTSPGTVMGTVGYMAPEQVRGQNADHRVDIFACGVVLYEMLSGHRAFEGLSPADTMSAILNEDPPTLSSDELRVPLTVDRVVMRCLEKEPSQRFQSAHDLAYALDALEGSSTTSGQTATLEPAETRRRYVLPLTAVVTLIIGVLVGLFLGVRQGAERQAGQPTAAREKVTITPLTYKNLYVFSAAFAPDQRTVIFSGGEKRTVPSIYAISPDYPEPREVGLPGVHLLAVSTRGEMAVLTEPRVVAHRLFEGTLARVQVGGTGPRQILEGVRQATWSPDGSELAIVRSVDGVDRLEYPIGTVLQECAPGYLSDLRISPQGDRIAFFEHPLRFDNRGSLRVVDLSGKAVTLAEGYSSEEGIAWAPDGERLFYSASDSGGHYAIHSVDLEGNVREIHRETGGVLINDINDDGTWLVTSYRGVSELWARGPGMEQEKNLSWLDSSVGEITPDGRALVFTEQGGFAGSGYSVCLRSPVDSDVVRLGEGMARDMSPDGKWVLAIVHDPPRFVAYPTGPGETREINRGLETYIHVQWFPDSERVLIFKEGAGNRPYVQSLEGGPVEPIDAGLETYIYVELFPDGGRVLICGSKEGTGNRCYVQSLEGGPAEPVSPEGILVCGGISPSGDHFWVLSAENEWAIYPTTGGEPIPLPGLDPTSLFMEELVMRRTSRGYGGWAPDGRGLLFSHPDEFPIVVERYDLESGTSREILTLGSSDRDGLLVGGRVNVAMDGQSYSYVVFRNEFRLFTVKGLR